MWTIEDVIAGRCTMDDVGSAKPQVPSTMDQALNTPTLRALVEGSITPKTQVLFNKWAEQNPGVYFPLLAKSGLPLMAKEEGPKLPALNKLTPADMAVYSSNDMKLMMAYSVGITTKQEAQDALDRGRAAEGIG